MTPLKKRRLARESIECQGSPASTPSPSHQPEAYGSNDYDDTSLHPGTLKGLPITPVTPCDGFDQFTVSDGDMFVKVQLF